MRDQERVTHQLWGFCPRQYKAEPKCGLGRSVFHLERRRVGPIFLGDLWHGLSRALAISTVVC